MKSTTDYEAKKDYPRLLISKDTENVWMQIREDLSICIHVNNPFNKYNPQIGSTASELNMTAFEEYRGTVTLSN
jgi:hypothetical protein